MKKGNSSSAGGSSTLSILGIVFIVLKLTGNISWSWWWVTAPFWGGLILVLAVILIAVFLKLIFD